MLTKFPCYTVYSINTKSTTRKLSSSSTKKQSSRYLIADDQADLATVQDGSMETERFIGDDENGRACPPSVLSHERTYNKHTISHNKNNRIEWEVDSSRKCPQTRHMGWGREEKESLWRRLQVKRRVTLT